MPGTKPLLRCAACLALLVAASAAQSAQAREVHFMLTNMATALPQVSAGKLKALGVTSAQRSALAPDLPTLADAGLPGFEYSTW